MIYEVKACLKGKTYIYQICSGNQATALITVMKMCSTDGKAPQGSFIVKPRR